MNASNSSGMWVNAETAALESRGRVARLVKWLESLIRARISTELTLAMHRDSNAYRLVYGDRVIEMPAWSWPTGNSLQYCGWFDAAQEGFRSPLGRPIPAPGIEQLQAPVIVKTSAGYRIGFDILGMAFWMLSRAEEVGRDDLDAHGRFPASSSHAFRFGYLDRPVVDEWFAVLADIAERVWPGIVNVENRFAMRLSHDVDTPSAFAYDPVFRMLKSMCGDVYRRRKVSTAVLRPWIWLTSRQRLSARDPYNTFDWLMDHSESHDVKSAFYFVCGGADRVYDPVYEVDHPSIRNLIRRINSRGHEIGLHPSYGSYRSPDLISREAKRLLAVCAGEGVRQQFWGSRMHYLRWATPETLHHLEQAGMHHDSSLGYADQPGFRCGTSHEYTALDPITWQSLNLKVRPLIAMECTLLDDSYVGLGATEAAADRFLSLKNACRAVGGTFSLLWHNNRLSSVEERSVYQRVLEG